MSLLIPPREYDYNQMMMILTRIDQRLQNLERAFARDVYAATPVADTRTIDAATATVADVANVLATLIKDLKVVGRLP